MPRQGTGAPIRDVDAARGGAKTLRVSQIVVNLVLLNEHDAPVTPEPVVFAGTEDGSAVENLASWLETLPMQLQLVAAATPEENGAA